MRIRQLIGVFLLAEIIMPHAEAQARGTRSRSSRIALRRRLHASSLITDPGTVEVEWNGLWASGGTWSMPTTLKWTPEGSQLIWGRTEYSVNFDAFEINGSTHVSDHIALTATSLLVDGEHWNLAVAPSITSGFRDQSSIRGGMTAIARYDFRRNSAGSTVSWTSTPGTWDVNSGFGHVFGDRLTAHVDVQHEQVAGFESTFSSFEGLQYQITSTAALDVSAQHLNLTGGTLTHQLLIGLTINFGKPSGWLHRK